MDAEKSIAAEVRNKNGKKEVNDPPRCRVHVAARDRIGGM